MAVKTKEKLMFPAGLITDKFCMLNLMGMFSRSPVPSKNSTGVADTLIAVLPPVTLPVIQLLKIDVRVVTATHKNLADEVINGNFRADLFYRLMGLPIHLTPLRERGNDIIILARHFADEFSKENKKKKIDFTEEAITKLKKYSFTGNVIELMAIIELAIILCENNRIDAQHISFNPVGSFEELNSEDMTIDEQILKIVRNCLQKNNGNPTIVSKKLGISRATVYRFMKALNL